MTIVVPMPFSEEDLKEAQATTPLIDPPEEFKPVEKNVQGTLRRLVETPPAKIEASDWIESDLDTEREFPPSAFVKMPCSPEQAAANKEAHAKYCRQVPVGLVETPKPFTLGEAVAEMTALQLKGIMEGGLHPKPIVSSGSNCSHGNLVKKFQDTINKNIVDPTQFDVEQTDLQKQFRREISEELQQSEADYFGPFALNPFDNTDVLKHSMLNAIPTQTEASFDIPDVPVETEAKTELDPQTLKRENSSLSGAFLKKDHPWNKYEESLAAKSRRESVQVTEEAKPCSTQYSRQRDMSIQTLRTKLNLLVEKAKANDLVITDPALKEGETIQIDDYEKAGNQLIASLIERSAELTQSELTWGRVNVPTQHQDLMDQILGYSRILNFRDDQLTKELRRRKKEAAK